MTNISAVGQLLSIDLSSYTIKQLTLDSRAAMPGSAFIAIKGHALNGAQFIASALENGASLVLVDSACQYQTENENVFQVEKLADKLAKVASVFYGKPSEQFNLVGVTGTNGKSTVANMLAYLSNACAKPASVIGTLGYGQPDSLTPLANTTPSAIELQHIFSEFVAHSSLVAMEVSSHGLMQNRVAECDFDVAIFTNLSRDHLDYHGTMQAYADAKKQLFTDYSASHCVINIDDDIGRLWLTQNILQNPIVYGHQICSQGFDNYVSIEEVDYLPQGMKARFATSWGNADLFIPLFGLFNLYNLAAAMSALLALDYSFADLVNSIKNLTPVAGRMEPFTGNGHPTCIVDYAHTPDALAQALKSLSSHTPNGITCVFGCGGDRDQGKRPMMAKAAQKYATRIVVTNDNPRNEDEQQICNDIIAGFENVEPIIELNRKKAIEQAIEITPIDGVVLIAGKGHEDYQIIAGQTLKFSDRDVVKNKLEGRAK